MNKWLLDNGIAVLTVLVGIVMGYTSLQKGQESQAAITQQVIALHRENMAEMRRLDQEHFQQNLDRIQRLESFVYGSGNYKGTGK